MHNPHISVTALPSDSQIQAAPRRAFLQHLRHNAVQPSVRAPLCPVCSSAVGDPQLAQPLLRPQSLQNPQAWHCPLHALLSSCSPSPEQPPISCLACSLPWLLVTASLGDIISPRLSCICSTHALRLFSHLPLQLLSPQRSSL